MAESPAILLTGVGKRYDIVACFAQLTTTIAVDPNPLAPAQYAAHVRAAPPPIADPGYVPFLRELCERHGVGAVVPLTDLDIEVLARARAERLLPALVPSPEVARATYDKYEAHLLLLRLGLPSPPTVLPEEEPDSYPVMVKPRRGSGARSIHLARDRAEKDFFVRYVAGEWGGQVPGEQGGQAPSGLVAGEEGSGEQVAGGQVAGVQVAGERGGWGGRGPIVEGEPVMVQRAMGGPELSIDCLGDLEGRCLNAIPRTMLESRGGESIKGAVIRDPELIALGRRVMEALAVRGPATIQVFRDPEVGLGITDVNTRFGGAFPAPAYAALPGRTYPELIVRMAGGETIAPHVGEFREGHTFTRYYWQLELDERLQPTGREIVPGRPPAPRP
jgi:carbamoyl-phosphate synthase large subunit